jgi:ribosome maturation factor RimP
MEAAARRTVMALNLDTIRTTAERVAASHHLEVVDLEFQGGVKFRTLRIFIEKDAAERTRMAAKAAEEDADFGTVVDVEDLIPGSEYTLEVSSPGLERKLRGPEDYVRFTGSLLKLQTFTPVNNNRHWQGRLTGIAGDVVTLDLSAVKQKGKAKKAATATMVEIPLANVEKAQLVAEI